MDLEVLVAENLFEKIAAGIKTIFSSENVMMARKWFREEAQKITNVNLRQLFEQGNKKTIRVINISAIGSMFMYHYDPKLKDKLPYYDTFPLIFVIEIYNDGFLGINLHYLPPYYRAKLMDALYEIATVPYAVPKKDKDKPQKNIVGNDKMKLQISYNILKSASRFRLFRPCVKRYLFSHVTSRYLFVEPDKWDMVLMLPTQRFVKASEDQVYRDSARMM
jgi:hypothetical protein